MNKTLFLVFSFCSLLFSQNPCDDPRYQSLKKKNLDSMTQREFEYYMLKERYCMENQGHTPANDPCSLHVALDSAVVDGKNKDFKLYIDDVETTLTGKTVICVIPFGVHKVSLFSLEEIDDFEKKINRRILTNDNNNHFYGIGVMETRLRQMKSTLKTINALPGNKIVIRYKFTCDLGKTGKCTDDGWSMIPEIN
jgi:hypothetical protein